MERRGSPRIQIQRPCALVRPATGRADTGLTRDVSSGGALIEVRSARSLGVGERVRVMIAPREGVVVRSETLREASVVRSTALDDGRQVVALRYAQAHAPALAAAA